MPKECRLCNSRLAPDYVKTACGHFFCRTCLGRYFASRESTQSESDCHVRACPICQFSLPEDITRTPKKACAMHDVMYVMHDVIDRNTGNNIIRYE